MKAAIAAVLLAFAACSAVLKTSSPLGSSPSPSSSSSGDIVMPDLTDKTPEEAALLVKAAGITQAIEQTLPTECVDAHQIEGKINCQSPSPGDHVKSYTLVQINVYHEQHIDGVIGRAQMEKLIGMTPDQARKTLASYGHHGEVNIDDGDFYQHCEQNRICAVDEEAGAGIDDPVTLHVNPALTISGPPP